MAVAMSTDTPHRTGADDTTPGEAAPPPRGLVTSGSYSITVRIHSGDGDPAVRRPAGDSGQRRRRHRRPRTRHRRVAARPAGHRPHLLGRQRRPRDRGRRRDPRQCPASRCTRSSDRVFLIHLGGKIERRSRRFRCETATTCPWPTPPASDASAWPSPSNPEDVSRLTVKGNSVAVVTDGSAVLGLGNIGPRAAMPVMEGKAALFKRFANIDAWPICLDTQDVDEIVRTVELIAPGFGGHQPRGHRRAPVLRGRGPAAREARHPGVPRRPARHGDRRPRRAAQRVAVRGQADRGRPHRRRRWRRGRVGDRLAAAGRRRARHRRVGPRGHPPPGRRRAVAGQARARRADQPAGADRRPARRGRPAPTSSSG